MLVRCQLAVAMAVEESISAHMSCQAVCNETRWKKTNIVLRKRPQTVNDPQHEVIGKARHAEERQQVEATWGATGGVQPQQEAISQGKGATGWRSSSTGGKRRAREGGNKIKSK
jgi:hypothetical protein